jgi:hypothetical protein
VAKRAAPITNSEGPVSAPVTVPPVSPMTEDSARQLGKAVWDRGVVSRRQHFLGIRADSADRWVAHAEAMGFVMVEGDSLKRGPVNPVPGRCADLSVRARDALVRAGSAERCTHPAHTAGIAPSYSHIPY